jgi:hypothetical protein
MGSKRGERYTLEERLVCAKLAKRKRKLLISPDYRSNSLKPPIHP